MHRPETRSRERGKEIRRRTRMGKIVSLKRTTFVKIKIIHALAKGG